jgi:hypothetical protein
MCFEGHMCFHMSAARGKASTARSHSMSSPPEQTYSMLPQLSAFNGQQGMVSQLVANPTAYSQHVPEAVRVLSTAKHGMSQDVRAAYQSALHHVPSCVCVQEPWVCLEYKRIADHEHCSWQQARSLPPLRKHPSKPSSGLRG